MKRMLLFMPGDMRNASEHAFSVRCTKMNRYLSKICVVVIRKPVISNIALCIQLYRVPLMLTQHGVEEGGQQAAAVQHRITHISYILDGRD